MVRVRNIVVAALAGVLLLGVTYAFQRPWREYPAFEYENFPIPPDAQEKTEWVFARLMYPPIYGNRYRRLAAGPLALDHGLSALGPSLLGGAAAPDAHPRALGGAARQPG